jgi:hypothetical protein
VAIAWTCWIAGGLLVAYLGKNYNNLLMTGFGIGIVGALGYALSKHTETTLKIIVFLVVVGVVGSVFNSCSKSRGSSEITGPGFR